jgi:hypothetical protein
MSRSLGVRWEMLSTTENNQYLPDKRRRNASALTVVPAPGVVGVPDTLLDVAA